MIAYAGPQLRAVLHAALVCSKYIVCAVCICLCIRTQGDIRIPQVGICVWQLVKGCVGSAQKQRWDCGQSYVRLCV